MQVTDWLRTEGDSYLESHVSYGQNASETEELIEMHSRFERSFKVSTVNNDFYFIETFSNLANVGHSHLNCS